MFLQVANASWTKGGLLTRDCCATDFKGCKLPFHSLTAGLCPITPQQPIQSVSIWEVRTAHGSSRSSDDSKHVVVGQPLLQADRSKS